MKFNVYSRAVVMMEQDQDVIKKRKSWESKRVLIKHDRNINFWSYQDLSRNIAQKLKQKIFF